MTASERRRPVTASDFNRLLFALLLLAALAVLARLITKQETRAEATDSETTLAQWVQAADALFLKSEWTMAADAYFGALEAATRDRLPVEPMIQKKLSICLAELQDHRSAVHFMRLYRMRLLDYRENPSAKFAGAPVDEAALEQELIESESLLMQWEAAGA